MTRYWPLTFVLLAFWLGRETVADGKGDETAAEFDLIRAKGILLDGQDKLGNRYVTLLSSDGVEVGIVPKGADLTKAVVFTKLDRRGLALGRAETVQINEFGATWSREKAVVDKHSLKPVFLRGSTTLELKAVPDSGSIKVCDGAGRTRAVLGATETANTQTGATTKHAESTLTLYDAKGNVMTQLPK